jgi:two-component system, OmpR family, sensor histidine kinase CiaH
LLKINSLAKVKSRNGKALFQFYLLVVYILLQFLWWAYLIAQLNREVHDLKVELVRAENGSISQDRLDELNKNLYNRWLMIGGEGTVFSFILILGISQTRRSFKREAQLAEQQKNFLMSVTHELKTPVASLRLQIETMMLRKLEKEHQDKILHLALDETERLNALIEKVLLANQLDAKGFPISADQVDLLQLNNWLQQLSHSPWLKEHRFSFQIPQEGIIFTDYLSLQSVIINLLENSCKYSPPGSRVDLQVSLREEGYTLVVSDNGPGIAPEFQTKIFDKFFRIGSEETRSAKGTGLGLYIVKNLVRYMGGNLQLLSEPGKGLTIKIDFFNL